MGPTVKWQDLVNDGLSNVVVSFKVIWKYSPGRIRETLNILSHYSDQELNFTEYLSTNQSKASVTCTRG
jgi:hypothetical protein